MQSSFLIIYWHALHTDVCVLAEGLERLSLGWKPKMAFWQAASELKRLTSGPERGLLHHDMNPSVCACACVLGVLDIRMLCA